MTSESLSEQYPGYRIEDRSVAMTEIPAWTWVMMVLLLVLPVGLFAWLHRAENVFDLSWVAFAWMLVLLLLHEGTHAVAWKGASGLPWSVFTFGVQWKTLTPYCHSTRPMGVRPYRIGALTPLIMTGLLPWFVSLSTGDVELAMASAVLISGAGGDLYILWSIRNLPEEVLLQDHSSRAGCVVLWPDTGGHPG